MKRHSSSIKRSHQNKCCIDDMDTMLNQIAEFKRLVKNTNNKNTEAFDQEYRLFKQYLEWKSEDLQADSYIKKIK